MREEDLDPLRLPFDPPSPSDVPSAFADALAATAPAARALAQAVFDDLDEKGLGIGWWAPHPDARRRILIGDYLFGCSSSIETHLVEGRLHLMEVIDCWEQEAARVRVSYDDRGYPRPAQLVARTPAEYLCTARSDMHLAGFFGSILAALDCLGATIIGVTAIAKEIVRGRLDKARKGLKVRSPPQTEGERLLAVFAERFESIVKSSGPPGWLEWVDDFRNTSVHRARRLQGLQVKPQRPIFGADGRPLSGRASVVFHLPLDPGLTEIEAFREPKRGQLLHEDGKLTLHGMFSSARALSDGVCAELNQVWRVRRSTPDLVHQPAEQWPTLELHTRGFKGYAPGSEELNPGLYASNPQFVRRLAAARLLNDGHKDWDKL